MLSLSVLPICFYLSDLHKQAFELHPDKHS